LNVPLKVELRDITDREAVVAMDIENRQRQDISPYERGVSYARWLRQGVFQSQDELAGALRVSAAHVSRLLKIARLPPIILSAFQDVRQLCEAWAMEIAVALEDPVKRDSILRVARELTRTMPPPSAREVSRRLLAAPAKGRKPIAKRTDQVIFDEEGRPLFRVRHERTTIALLLPPDRISATTLKEVCSTLKTVLQRDLGLGLDGPQRIAAAPEASGRVAALPVCVPISSKGR